MKKGFRLFKLNEMDGVIHGEAFVCTERHLREAATYDMMDHIAARILVMLQSGFV